MVKWVKLSLIKCWFSQKRFHLLCHSLLCGNVKVVWVGKSQAERHLRLKLICHQLITKDPYYESTSTSAQGKTATLKIVSSPRSRSCHSPNTLNSSLLGAAVPAIVYFDYPLFYWWGWSCSDNPLCQLFCSNSTESQQQSVLLFCCLAFLLFCCFTVLLSCCFTVLLFCFFTVLLFSYRLIKFSDEPDRDTR